MLSVEEKSKILGKLPTDDSLSLESIAESIKLLHERQEIVQRELQELEKRGLYFDTLSRFFVLKKQIEKSGVPVAKLEELTDLFNHQRKNVIAHDEMSQATMLAIQDVSKKCPECGQSLILRPITKPKGRQNLYGWKSSLFCECGYEEFSTEEFSARQQELRAKAKPLSFKFFSLLQQALPPVGVTPRSLLCPKCEASMVLQRITEPKGPKNLFGWKTVKRCFNCGNEEFSTQNIKKQMRVLSREVKHGDCY